MISPIEVADSCEQAAKDMAEMRAQLLKARRDLTSLADQQSTLEANLRQMRARCVNHTIVDTELVSLGDRLKEALSEQETIEASGIGDWQEGFDRSVTKIVRDIANHPAQTLAGLRVKALALTWCQAGGLVGDSEEFDRRPLEMHLAADLSRELLQLGKPSGR